MVRSFLQEVWRFNKTKMKCPLQLLLTLSSIVLQRPVPERHVSLFSMSLHCKLPARRRKICCACICATTTSDYLIKNGAANFNWRMFYRNLSTIQETSREYRSRSTTGSSSGTTMSTTRFLGNATSTQLNINSRSSSIPRSASRVSQNTNNGYYSDTNNY